MPLGPTNSHNPGGVGAGQPRAPQKYEQPGISIPNIPAPFFSEEDGDYWASNACFAVVALTLALAPWNNRGTKWIYPQNTVPAAVDEFYQAPVQTQQQYAQVQPFTDDEIIVTPVVTFQPDEDYYVVTAQQQYVPPPQVFTDPEEIPAGNLYAPPDEIFWAPGVTAQWPFVPPFRDTDDPAGSLYGVPDELFWQPPAPWPLSFAQVASDDPVIAAPLPLSPDEDFWWNPPVMTIAWTPFFALALVQDDGQAYFTPFVPPTTVGRSVRFGLQYPAFR